MRSLLRCSLAALALLLALTPARAQTAADADSGRLLVFENGNPVANERYELVPMGDSLVITALHQRQFQNEKGERFLFKKSMQAVVDSRDFRLQRYSSRQDFNGHWLSRGILPSDTSMTYFTEDDGAGDGRTLVQPPGRLFVMDPGLFTLFEIITRSLAGRTFEKRPLQLLAALPDSLSTPTSTVTLLAPDTLRAGGRRVPVRRYRLEDASTTFELWADARGRLLRLKNEPAKLLVVRDEPAPAPARPRARKAPVKR